MMRLDLIYRLQSTRMQEYSKLEPQFLGIFLQDFAPLLMSIEVVNLFVVCQAVLWDLHLASGTSVQ